MQEVRLRQVGGSVMLAIPPAYLNQLHLTARARVGLAIEGERLIVQPVGSRPKYSLAELIAQCDPNAPLASDHEWTTGEAVGSELI